MTLNQSQLAQRLGVSRAAVSKALRTNGRVAGVNLSTIAKFEDGKVVGFQDPFTSKRSSVADALPKGIDSSKRSGDESGQAPSVIAEPMAIQPQVDNMVDTVVDSPESAPEAFISGPLETVNAAEKTLDFPGEPSLFETNQKDVVQEDVNHENAAYSGQKPQFTAVDRPVNLPIGESSSAFIFGVLSIIGLAKLNAYMEAR